MSDKASGPVSYTHLDVYKRQVILGAFKPEKEMYTNLLGLPHQWVTDNFTTAWVKGNFEKYYVNTLIITVFQVLICTPLSAMLGFALSRKDLYGKKIITLALLAGLTIPAQVAIMPLFLQMKAFNLTNSIPVSYTHLQSRLVQAF